MLSKLQKGLAQLFLALPEAGHFALAGGAALVFKREVPRSTRDLDFFSPVPEEVTAAAERFKLELQNRGYAFTIVSSSPAFVRLLVRDRDEQENEVLVDIGHDFRLKEPDQTPLGAVLTTDELAADKMLALFGSAEARDFVDVFFLSRRLGVANVLAWARQKGPGFDPHVLAIMLGSFDRLPRREFEVGDAAFADMKIFFQNLRAELIDECFRD